MQIPIILKSIVTNALFKNSFFSILGVLISRGFIFLSWLLIARLVSVEQYGEVGLVRSTFNTLLAFGNLGLGMYATKEISRTKDDLLTCSNKVLSILSVGLVVNFLVCLLAYFLGEYLLEHSQGINVNDSMFESAYMAVPFALMSLLLVGIISGFEEYKRLAKINSIYGFISFVSLVSATYFGGVDVLLFVFYALFFIQFLMLACLFVYLLKIRGIKLVFPLVRYKSELYTLFRFCFPGFCAGLLYIPVRWYCEILMFSTESGSEELGLFYAAQLFNTLFVMLAFNLSTPIFTRLSGGKVSDSLKSINMHLNWHLGVVIAIPFLIFPKLTLFFLGGNYSESEFVLIFYLTISYTIVFMYKQGVGRVVAADGKMWLFFQENLVFAAVLLTTFSLFKASAYSLATSYLVASFSSTVFLVTIYRNNLNLKLSDIYDVGFFYAAIIFFICIFVALNYQSHIVFFINSILSLILLLIISRKYSRILKF
ncbi:oligosaccharide flippase family protein [Vibrio parahaemolyticus]|uniref:oligosaccharide flippase family protein n=1 Tax=Vibrio parahaemolyticus TaxID=670 RepID=UPI00128EB476|nr:oligosaccharide flippase family protein [Vibrio parahaemolyticus]MQC20460.1 hypothetical protein [Vibrio parahaemolyticus]